MQRSRGPADNDEGVKGAVSYLAALGALAMAGVRKTLSLSVS
jgi:hypothetical protein